MKRFIAGLILASLAVACGRQGLTNYGTGGSGGPTSGSVGGSGAGSTGSSGEVEGTINGGGGRAVVCAANGKTSVETLDLYEARTNGAKLIKLDDDQDKAVDQFIVLLTRHFNNPDTVDMQTYRSQLRAELHDKWLKQIRFLPKGKRLKKIADSHEVIEEAGCDAVQIAAYYDESTIEIVKEYWDRMDETNRVALLAHELIYFIDRSNGVANSIASRKLVGQLFSEQGARPKADGIPTDRKLVASCHANDGKADIGYFYAYDSQAGDAAGTELVFNYLRNSDFLFRTSAFLPSVKRETIFKAEASFSSESNLDLDSYAQPTQRLLFEFLGDGKAKLRIQTLSDRSISAAYDVQCGQPVSR